MYAEDLLEQLADLARAAGLTVREIGRAGEAERETPSGTCRVNGEVWVLLSAADAIEDRIDVLAAALGTHAAAFLEARYLPPAIRARVNGERGGA